MKKEYFSFYLGDGLPHKEFVLDINTELKVKHVEDYFKRKIRRKILTLKKNSSRNRKQLEYCLHVCQGE